MTALPTTSYPIRPVRPRRPARPSPLQDAILEFLRDWKRDEENDGNSPSYSDIARALAKYPANIHRYVGSMERKGLVRINRRGKITLPGGKYIPPE